MSAKWVRSKAWDDRVFPSWAWPAKATLRALSSIWLSVMLLSCVVLYGIAASVPIGLLAKIPTYLLYGLALGSLVAAMVLIGCGLAWIGLQRASRVVRVAVVVPLGVVLAGAAWVIWTSAIWPMLKWDPGTGSGFMLFAEFIERNKSITLRRLPYVEMSELEFYSWWPLRVILLTFVLNMIVATVRRIEFRFVNLGVLMVHTGIVLLALGSIYYGTLKREGDMILGAGPPPPEGGITPGGWKEGFYDGQAVAVCIRPTGGLRWLTIPVQGVPRYNDYALLSSDERSAWSALGAPEEAQGGATRTLSIPVRPPPSNSSLGDVRMRIVGYASYGEPALDYRKVEPGADALAMEELGLNPVRAVAIGRVLDNGTFAEERTGIAAPGIPRFRDLDAGGATVEVLEGISDERRAELTYEVVPGSLASLVIEMPRAEGEPILARASLVGEHQGQPWMVRDEIPIADTGWTIQLEEFQPKNTMRIITKGYEDAESAVAIVRLTPPEGEPFRRYVYARFPEIAQDILDTVDPETGRPIRRDPDPAVRLGLIDSSRTWVHLCTDAAGHVQPIIRERGGKVSVGPWIDEGGVIAGLPGGKALRLGERWAHAEPVVRPVSVPEAERERDMVGNHGSAWIGVEVTSTEHAEFRRVVWLPFNKYLASGMTIDRDSSVRLPDGRTIDLAFGRVFHHFRDFMIRLDDFHVEEYAHRGAPRDYQSTLSVMPHWRLVGRSETGEPLYPFKPFTHVAKLNAPLRAPWNTYDDSRSLPVRIFGQLLSGLNPDQYKFSQAGWDATTWEQTREQVAKGELQKPSVQFTILQVGNNPGIHVIALGGILMGVGIPWAFYLKPWLIRRKSQAIRRQVEAGTYVPPARSRSAAVQDVPSPQPAEVSA